MDVVDLRWRGTLTGAQPISGLAFLLASGNLFWAKTPEISPAPSVQLSLHAYADHAIERATLYGGHSRCLPTWHRCVRQGRFGGGVHCRNGRAHDRTRVMPCSGQPAALFVLLFPRDLLKVGRKRVWRVREEIALSFPPAIRELLTRRRTGSVLSELA
jgi:hypothetical protein